MAHVRRSGKFTPVSGESPPGEPRIVVHEMMPDSVLTKPVGLSSIRDENIGIYASLLQNRPKRTFGHVARMVEIVVYRPVAGLNQIS
jgi:hypothetical protein